MRGRCTADFQVALRARGFLRIKPGRPVRGEGLAHRSSFAARSAAKEAIDIEAARLEELKQIAKGIAATFGSNCEVVIHDVSGKGSDSSIVAIENGHVTGRKVGDGASQVALEQTLDAGAQPLDRLRYLTKTPDGKILKSSTMYIRGKNGKVAAILGINYDISALLMVEGAVHEITDTDDAGTGEPQKIVNVNDLLDELIEQSVALVGKPVALMNKDDKMKAIGFLSQSGAFLVTKSGDKIAKYFGISKYTLYSYIDKQEEKEHGQD